MTDSLRLQSERKLTSQHFPTDAFTDFKLYKNLYTLDFHDFFEKQINIIFSLIGQNRDTYSEVFYLRL